MTRPFRRYLPLGVLAIALASCDGKDHPLTFTLPPAVPTTALTIGAIFTGTLGNDTEPFSVPLDGAPGYVAILFDLSGPLGLTGFGADSTFRSPDCIVPPDSTRPKECGRSSGLGRWYIEVDGRSLPTAAYALLVEPSLSGGGAPMPEGGLMAPVDLEAGVSYAGQVGTRATSYYRAHGLVPGVAHTVTLFGLTGDIDLYAVGCERPGISTGVNTFPVACGGVTDSTTDFQVDCGPVNRDGARYWIVVR